ncbi:MAG: FAD-dependent oxidoreductase [Candidatus Caldatribacterium sp.]|nr:FAD-dependent oxidoreductase [Candidatus Caldatribacterium sp.]
MERCDILVVGGGIAGLAVASCLEGKYKVFVLEEKESFGGLAGELSCKATDRCLRCGVCRAVEILRKASFWLSGATGESIHSATWENGVFRVTTNQREIAASSVVLATGAVPFPVEKLPQYLWGRKRRIFTGFELEQKLREGTLGELSAFRSFAFVQCVGSRNAKESRGYCSRVCCRYALRLAENLRFRFPEASFDFYYMDLQILGDGEEDLRAIARTVSLIRSLPSALLEDEEGVTVSVEEGGRRTKRRYDAVVLSVGLVPSSGTEKMARIFGLPQREGGFIAEDGGRTLREGVFVCGTAAGPKDIMSTLCEAWSLAGTIEEFLGG